MTEIVLAPIPLNGRYLLGRLGEGITYLKKKKQYVEVTPVKQREKCD